MTMQDNKYVQAVQSDFDALKQKWDDMRQSFSDTGNGGGSGEASGGGNGKVDSRLAETAWADFQDQSEKLKNAGSAASNELRGSYEAARDKVKKVVEAYQRG
ncbi:hypothetical protein [Rhodospira trueperi]|uniref:Uncharacterized protein n=1 Tax=Rhodospira trueperi TaxID=69960 RepID=A0A1G7DAB3_9PROT|nr:hypothetical protein [Rhodospira trueperi]SDE48443.1 hypothetical protein SAMN05421720_10797 [Rhodospira trueperi]